MSDDEIRERVLNEPMHSPNKLRQDRRDWWWWGFACGTVAGGIAVAVVVFVARLQP